MSIEHVLLVVTAVVALLALAVALLALRALARIKSEQAAAEISRERQRRIEPVHPELVHLRPEPVPAHDEPQVQVNEGQVVVRPTTNQIVATTMHHPLVRLNVLMVGLSHALRPESRDRIGSLMRREFRARKTARRKAARRAARGVPAANSSAPLWVSTEAPPRELAARPFDVSTAPRQEIEA